MRYLIVVDMQNDFVDGALGSNEAQECVPFVVKRISAADVVYTTMDTHTTDYTKTLEGKMLPVPHCIVNTDGWKINPTVKEALDAKNAHLISKPTFGSLDLMDVLAEEIQEGDIIELCGVCTDICVVSNALLLRAKFPNVDMEVHAQACAGTSLMKHIDALGVMESCQIKVIRNY